MRETMKRNKLIYALLALLMAAAASAGLYYYINDNAPEHAGQSAQHAEQQPAAANAADDDIFDQAEGEAPTIEISEGAVKLMGVKSVAASLAPMRQSIRTIGRVEVDEKRLYDINAKIEGWIEKLFVDYTGKSVEKGQPVAEIYSPDLLATQQELLDAIKWSKGGGGRSARGAYNEMLAADSGALVKAAKQRLALWDISKDQVDRLIKTGKPMRTLTIYSPAGGYVIEKSAVQGARIMPGEKLYTIADLSKLWVIADVYESEVHNIKPSQEARITMGHLPGREIAAMVEFIYPSMNSATRTLQVRFEVDNQDGELRPSMYTDIELSVDLGQRLSVPKSAIIDSGQRQIVYVDKGQGYFEPRQVRAGMSGERLVEIVEGLEEGEMVAESGTFLLDSEAQLKGVKPLEAK